MFDSQFRDKYSMIRYKYYKTGKCEWKLFFPFSDWKFYEKYILIYFGIISAMFILEKKCLNK